MWFAIVFLGYSFASAQSRRKVIVNEDASGPGGSNMQTLMVMIQSPQVEVLGITVVSGDQWRDEEVAHTLRLLEIMGRRDIPVVAGAGFPLVRTREEAQRWQQNYGKVAYAGAWDERWWHEASVVPPLPEGQPTTKAADEDAAHFLIRMVRKYPHEVTIYEGGPMTNLALAISLDPQFPELAQRLVFMGGSLSPQTDNPEFLNNPRHEFNFWFDPEAAEIVLRAPWKKMVCTPTDISIKTHMTAGLVKQIEASRNAAGALHRAVRHADARCRHHVGRTGGRGVDRSDDYHEERDAVYGGRSRSRRGIWEHANVGGQGSFASGGAAGGDSDGSGCGKVLSDVRGVDDCGYAGAVNTIPGRGRPGLHERDWARAGGIEFANSIQ